MQSIEIKIRNTLMKSHPIRKIFCLIMFKKTIKIKKITDSKHK